MADRKGISNYSALKRQEYLSLTDIAYNVLLEGIINQDFQPGAPISIDNLSKQLKMSNTPVREALMRAHGERLVNQKTNHGFVVADILKPEEIAQLFDVRYALEVHALTVATLSAESVKTIANLVEQMQATSDGMVYDDYKEYIALDHQFHLTLIEQAGNGFLVDAWEHLHVHLHLSRLYTGVGLFDRNDATQEHHAILEALESGDKEKAVNLLGQHIQRVSKGMRSFLENGRT